MSPYKEAGIIIGIALVVGITITFTLFSFTYFFGIPGIVLSAIIFLVGTYLTLVKMLSDE